MSGAVVVTGCSRGIGLALVDELSMRGYKVLATCRNPDQASALQDVLQRHSQPPAIPLDIDNDESLTKAADHVRSLVDSVDVLINNAGVSNRNHPSDSVFDTDRQEMVEIFNTNVGGPLVVTRAFLPLLRRGNRPRVVNISTIFSCLGDNDQGGYNSYRISKIGLNMLTKNFAAEVKDVIFVPLHPGWVQTGMGGSMAPLTPQDSAKGVVDVMEKLTEKDSGKLVDYKGNLLQW